MEATQSDGELASFARETTNRPQKKRPRNDISSYENRARRTNPAWNEDTSGRLPIRLQDGTWKAAPTRIKQFDSNRNASSTLLEKEDALEAQSDRSSSSSTHDLEDESVSGESTNNSDIEEDDTDPTSEKVKEKVSMDRFDAALMKVKDEITSFAQLKLMAPAEVNARRAIRTGLIAELSQRIISDPEHNVSTMYAPQFSNSNPSNVNAKRGRGGKSHESGGRFQKQRKQNSLLALQQIAGLDPDPVVKRLAIMSLVAVFRDIVPGYRIRVPEKGKTSVQLKKDVKKLQDFESNLLTGYQRFLRLLEFVAKQGEDAARGRVITSEDDPSNQGNEETSKKTKERLPVREFILKSKQEKAQSHAHRDGLVPLNADKEVLVSLGLTAVKAMAALLTSLGHFNFRSNLVAFLVPRTCSKNEEISSVAASSIKEAFAGDVLGETSLELIRAFHALVKTATGKRNKLPLLHLNVLLCLNKLRVGILLVSDQVSRESNQEDLYSKKKKKEREFLKKKGGSSDDPFDTIDVKEGLKLADAENLKERKDNFKACLRGALSIYFRILKYPTQFPLEQARDKAIYASLLSPLLQGLSKFGRLIDVDVTSDLLEALKKLVTSGVPSRTDDNDGKDSSVQTLKKNPLSIDAACNAIITALEIMSGPGAMLNADETVFAQALFRLLSQMQEGWFFHGDKIGVEEKKGTVEKEKNIDEEHLQHPVLLICKAIRALLMERREENAHRVTAFAFKLLLLALHAPRHVYSLSFLCLFRQLAFKYPVIPPRLIPVGISLGASSNSNSNPSQGSSSSLTASSSLNVQLQQQQTMTLLNQTYFQVDCDQSNSAVKYNSLPLYQTLLASWHPQIVKVTLEILRNIPIQYHDTIEATWKQYNDDSGLFNPAIATPSSHPLAEKSKKAPSKKFFVKHDGLKTPDDDDEEMQKQLDDVHSALIIQGNANKAKLLTSAEKVVEVFSEIMSSFSHRKNH
jgi:Nucleolar complex-associated protein